MMAGVVLLAMLVFGFAAVTAAKDDAAKLKISGILLQTGPNDSVQGFLDVALSNVESTGVSFTLRYDTRYVRLSDVDTNMALLGGTVYGDDCCVKWSDDFPQGALKVVSYKVTQNTESNFATARIEIAVKSLNASETFDYGANIKEQKIYLTPQMAKETMVMDAAGKVLDMCSVSFEVVDASGLSKLNKKELADVFSVVTDSNEDGLFKITYIDNSANPPLVYYDLENNLDYTMVVENSITKVLADDVGIKPNAAEIFNGGVENDLLDWMNRNMQNVTVHYTNGTQISDSITWGGVANKDYAISPTYSAKGGTYTISQKYNDKINAMATVTVAPVTAVGLSTEKQYINYPIAPTGTDAKVMLELPDKASVTFDTVVPGKTDAVTLDVDGASWQCTLPDGSAAGSLLDISTNGAGTYVYTASIKSSALLPLWATDALGSSKSVSVDRSVGDPTPAPDWQTDFTARVDDDGHLVIDIIAVGGVTNLDGYTFDVRLPSGLVLNKLMFADPDSNYKVEKQDDGSVKINIKAETGQTSLIQAINLGKKLGSFGLTATAPGKPQSDWVDFSTEPRKNVYLVGPENGNYKFDYSSASSLLSVDTGSTLPLTVSLPQGDAVDITYSGLDGLEPGKLSVITVDSWQASGALVAGQTVTFTGTLRDGVVSASHGTIYNTKDVQVQLILMVTDEADATPEELADLSDIVFYKKQQGYTDYETRDVVLKNVGTVAINGLCVSIDPENGSEGAFSLVGNPANNLAPGDETTLTIRRNLGLTAGASGSQEYKALLTIGSSRTASLQTFNVSVTIVSGQVFNVILTVEPDTAGVATGAGGYTAGETVQLTATPTKDSNGDPDYEFDHWEVVNGAQGVTFDSGTASAAGAYSDNASFLMPDLSAETVQEVIIVAKFNKLDAALLHLESLRLFNPDDSENYLLLKNESGKYAKTTFEPLMRGYYAIVHSSAQTNRVEFSLPAEATSDKVEVSVYWNDVSLDSGAWFYDKANGKYVVNTPDLAVMPQVNKLTVKLARKDTANTVEKAYTVQIMRKLADEQMVTMNYGNSPFGLIMQHSLTHQIDTGLWKEKFRERNRFVVDYTPDNGNADVIYQPDAWADVEYLAMQVASVATTEEAVTNFQDVGNYDRNDYALFVYSGGQITDPGFGNVKNSLGETVDTDDVTATIYGLVKMPAYAAGESAVAVFKDGDDMDPVVLNGSVTLNERVRPGVYAISYEFVDYNGDKAVVKRPLIVLYQRGDVNMNGITDETDAQCVLNRYNSLLPTGLSGLESNCRIYQFRICDVNCDRNVNVGDRNAIRRGGLTQFYK